VYFVVTGLPADAVHHRKQILSYVGAGKFAQQNQIEAAVKFAVKNKHSAALDAKEFEEACGVGLCFRRAIADSCMVD
jgi:hypothetical protein